MNELPYDSTNDTRAHISAVRSLLYTVVNSLWLRAEEHDASKLQSPEKGFFDVATPRLKASTYGSDEYKGFLAEMKIALDHHYATYRHHPEHFRWHCPVCSLQLNNEQASKAPEGPNDSGKKYCPRCCCNGMLYESELMDAPQHGINGMNLIDLIEMLCDWKAATSRHSDGDIRKSVVLNQKRFGYSDELKRFLMNTVESMGW